MESKDGFSQPECRVSYSHKGTETGHRGITVGEYIKGDELLAPGIGALRDLNIKRNASIILDR